MKIELSKEELKRLVEYIGHSNAKDVYDKLEWLDEKEQEHAAKVIGSAYSKLSDKLYESEEST